MHVHMVPYPRLQQTSDTSMKPATTLFCSYQACELLPMPEHSRTLSKLALQTSEAL